MECISRFTAVSPFLASPINLRRSFPRRVSIQPLRSSHDIHLIKPRIRERRRKEWWRWADLPDLDNPISDEDRHPMREDKEEEEEEDLSSDDEDLAEELEEEEDLSSDDEDLAEELEEEDLAEELEEMEEEAMAGLDEGREPSDYDRRAQIFDESSRVFTALKEMNDNGDGDNSS